MNEFTLLPGESVIKRCDEVSLKGMNLPVGKKDILILTNQYLNGSIYDIHGGYDYF